MDQNQTTNQGKDQPLVTQPLTVVSSQPTTEPTVPVQTIAPEALQDIESELQRLESANFSEPEPVIPAAPETPTVQVEPEVIALVPQEDTALAVSDAVVPPVAPVPDLESVIATAADTVKNDMTAVATLVSSDAQDISVTEDGTLLMEGQQAAPEVALPAAEVVPKSVPGPVMEPTPSLPQIPMQAAPGEPEPTAPEPAEISMPSPVSQESSIIPAIEPASGVIEPSEPDEEPAESQPINVITGEREAAPLNQPAIDSLAAAQVPTPDKPKTPGKPKPFVLFFVVGAVIALFASVAIAAYVLQPKKTDSTKATSSSTTLKDSEPTTIQAATVTDYAGVCGGKTVTNAADYTGTEVHPAVVFEKQQKGYALASRTFKDASLASVSTVQLVQLVGCVMRDESFAGNVLKTCPLVDNKKVTVNVEYLSAKYTVDIYEAKTGKKIGSKSVSSLSSTCPDTAVFTTPDPKVFASLETVDIESTVAMYSAKTK